MGRKGGWILGADPGWDGRGAWILGADPGLGQRVKLTGASRDIPGGGTEGCLEHEGECSILGRGGGPESRTCN